MEIDALVSLAVLTACIFFARPHAHCAPNVVACHEAHSQSKANGRSHTRHLQAISWSTIGCEVLTVDDVSSVEQSKGTVCDLLTADQGKLVIWAELKAAQIEVLAHNLTAASGTFDASGKGVRVWGGVWKRGDTPAFHPGSEVRPARRTATKSQPCASPRDHTTPTPPHTACSQPITSLP